MKNKANAMYKAQRFNDAAEHFVAIFIATQHLDGAERLAERVLEKIRAVKKVKKEPPNAFLQDFPVTIEGVKK